MHNMSKKKICIFVPADKNNEQFFQYFKNSLRKFHNEEELPLFRYDNPNPADSSFWYRATPIIAKDLIKEFEIIIKADADQIITGSLSHIWEGEFDVAVVQNSNPRDWQSHLQATGQLLSLLTIDPLEYVNNGLVVMKSEKFINHWNRLCNSKLFNNFPFAEQGLLNILVHFGDYNVKFLDYSNKWHGLISKGFYPQVVLKENKLFLLKNEEWPKDEDKEIVCLHWAGGNDPDKGNYRIRFQPEVVKYLDNLIK